MFHVFKNKVGAKERRHFDFLLGFEGETKGKTKAKNYIHIYLKCKWTITTKLE